MVLVTVGDIRVLKRNLLLRVLLLTCRPGRQPAIEIVLPQAKEQVLGARSVLAVLDEVEVELQPALGPARSVGGQS